MMLSTAAPRQTEVFRKIVAHSSTVDRVLCSVSRLTSRKPGSFVAAGFFAHGEYVGRVEAVSDTENFDPLVQRGAAETSTEPVRAACVLKAFACARKG